MDNTPIFLQPKVKHNRRTKIAFIIMGVLLGLSLTTTIVLAAFTAGKTSTATLTFASGLTLKLDPLDSSAAIHITSAPAAVTGTFSYTNGTSNDTFTNLDAPVTLNGIKATPNKAAYIAYQLTLKIGANNAGGSWGTVSSNKVTFTATDDWKLELTLQANWVKDSSTNSTIVIKKSSTTSTSGEQIFASIYVCGKTTATNMNALAGLSLGLEFSIQADTAATPTTF